MKTSIRRLSTLLAAASALLGCIQRQGPAPSEPPAATAAEPADALPAGKSVLAPDGIASFQVSGAAAKVALSVVDVRGQPFDEALSVEIQEAGQSPWEVQGTSPTTERVERGDVLLATFYVRVEKEQESGGGETEFV